MKDGGLCTYAMLLWQSENAVETDIVYERVHEEERHEYNICEKGCQ